MEARDDPAFVVVASSAKRVNFIVSTAYHSSVWYHRITWFCLANDEVLIFFLAVVAIAYGIALGARGLAFESSIGVTAPSSSIMNDSETGADFIHLLLRFIFVHFLFFGVVVSSVAASGRHSKLATIQNISRSSRGTMECVIQTGNGMEHCVNRWREPFLG